MNFTKEQLEAINVGGGNVLISAAAGSGKTAVLVERIIRKVLEGADINEFLIVTFTKQSASDMRKKILKALEKVIADNPANRHLLRQRTLIYKTDISTIDSFFSDIVRKYAYTIQMAPDFLIAEKEEIEKFESDALNKTLALCYERAQIDNDYQFNLLLDIICDDKTDKALSDIILNIYQSVSGYPFFNVWKYEQIKILTMTKDNYSESIYFNQIKSFMLEVLMFHKKELSNMLMLFQDNEELLSYVKMYKSDISDIEQVIGILEKKCGYQDLHSLLVDIDLSKRASSKCADKEFLGAVKEIRNNYKSDMTEFISLFKLNENILNNYLKQFFKAVVMLLDITEEFSNNLDEIKKKKNKYSFNDIAKKTAKILIDDYDAETDVIYESPVAREISAKYKEILIDEYQDTSFVQDIIFRSISKKEGNLFVVGDIKQSIYRFRQAMPWLFIKKRELFKSLENSFVKNLTKNFRSASGIIDFVNYIFDKTMSEALGETEYSGSERLVLGSGVIDENAVEVNIIENNKDSKIFFENNKDLNKEDIVFEEIAGIEKEAVFTAKKIKEIVENQTMIFDKKTKKMREIKYSDICILFLSGKNKICPLYSNIFSQFGMPLETVEDTVDNSYELSIIIAVLKAIDNPLDETAVFAAMKSVIFGFDMDYFVKIKKNNKEKSIYEIITENSTDDRTLEFIEFINKYSLMSKDIKISELINQLYNEKEIFMRFGIMQNGQERINALVRLYQYAEDFEKSGYKGLYNFILHIENTINVSGGLKIISKISSEDSIKLMTIHKSKGLEFPVVFLINLSKKFNSEDYQHKFAIDVRFGIGLPFYNEKTGILLKNPVCESIKQKIENESLSEEMRLLYVALTRAEQKLYLSFVIDTSEKCDIKSRLIKYSSAVCGKNFIYPYSLMKNKNYAYWIMSALFHHPCLKNLRAEYNILGCIPFSSNGSVKCNLINNKEIEDIFKKTYKIENVKETKKLKENIENIDFVRNILNFEYNFQNSCTLPAKLSVSELNPDKELITDAEDLIKSKADFREPFFVSGYSSDFAKKGIAVHKFMQYTDFYMLQKNGTQAEAERIKQKHFIKISDLKLLDFNMIEKFRKSMLIKELICAKKIYREYRFNIKLDILDYYQIIGEVHEKIKEINTGEDSIIVQGVIDCLYQNSDDEFILLDYKTDRNIDDDEFIKRYKNQLDLYKFAAEKSFDITINKKIVYSFDKAKIIEIK